MNSILTTLAIFLAILANALFGQKMLVSYLRRREMLPVLARLQFFPDILLMTWLWPITAVGIGVYEIMRWARKKNA